MRKSYVTHVMLVNYVVMFILDSTSNIRQVYAMVQSTNRKDSTNRHGERYQHIATLSEKLLKLKIPMVET